jgi:hypothetical protein
MSLLEHFDGLWLRVQEALPQERSAQKVRSTLLALLAAFGLRTVTGALTYLGLADKDWSGRYRHFSRSPWQAQAIFAVAAAEAVNLVPAEHPFIPISLDDTSLPCVSAKGGLASYGKDPASPKFHVNLRRGLRHVHAALVVPVYEDHCRPLAISTAFDLCAPVKKPPKKAGPEAMQQWKQDVKQHNLSVTACSILGRQRDALDAQGLSHRTLLAVVDGSYLNKTIITKRPQRCHIIGRCRKDAVLYRPGATPKRYGPRASTPEQLRTDDSVPWSTCSAHYAGRMQSIDYKCTSELRWRATGTLVPVRIITLRPIPYTGPGGRRGYRQPAYLLTTDLTTSVELLIQAYLDRWQIEVLHRDLKHDTGLGTAQVRNPQSVAKLHASVVAANALLNLAAHFHCQRHRNDQLPPLPKWRRILRRRTTSQQEILTLLRHEMACSGTTPGPSDGSPLPPREQYPQAA